MKLKDVVSIKPITRVIDFQSRDRSLINGYVMMEETAEYFVDILEGFTRLRDEKTTEKRGSIVPAKVNRSSKITGTYGVGKSYFLLMLKAMLEALENSEDFNNIVAKINNFQSIKYQLDQLNSEGKKYIIVDINGKSFAEVDFKTVIEKQIYRKLIETIGKEKLNFNSFYNKTIKQLRTWKKYNDRMYIMFKEKFLDDADYEYNEMIERLENRDTESKDVFIKIFETIIGEKPSNEFETLRDFIKESSENVKNNGYDGIVVLFDEFSTYLLGRAEKGLLNIDLGSIDILAESTEVSSLNDIYFITTEHEDMEKILKKNISDMKTVTKTAGRFKNYSLYFEKGADLVENVIERDKTLFSKLKFENSNIFDKYKEINDYADLKDIYPLNPYTLEYLVKISEKYAQGDRTLFTFIDLDLRKYIEQNEVMLKGNQLNLVSVDAVMDCFGSTLVKGETEFAKAYNIQMERSKSHTQQKVVKALALDYAVTITDVGKIKSGINDENIGFILSLSDKELKDVKTFLSKEINDSNSYIIYNDGINGYELSPDSQGIDIEEEINKVLIHTDEKRFLESLIIERSSVLDIKSKYIIPKASKIFPFDRIMDSLFIKSLGELKSLNITDEVNKCINDGKVIFYLPAAGQSYDFEEIKGIAKEKVSEFINEKIVIAIPKKFTFAGNDVALLKRYEALSMLTKNEKIMSNPKAQNIVRLEIVRLRNEIYNKLRSFGRSENFVFLFKDEVIENVSDMNKLHTEWLTKKLYPKFPIIDAEDFSTRNAGNQLIQNLIVPKKMENVNLNSSKVYVKHINMTLKPLDLVEIRQTVHGYRVEIKKPKTNPIASEIFKVLEIPEEEKTIKEKYYILTSPPYGLNNPLFEVLFSIFVRTSDKHYLLSKDDARVKIDADNANMIWEKDFKLCITKDAVPFILKKDAINILEMIAKNYLDGDYTYKDLKPTMPSDEFGDHKYHSIIAKHINTMKDKIEVFKSNMAQVVDNISTTEFIDDIIKYLQVTSDIIHPNELLNSISNLINTHFNTNVTISEDDDNIDILRYEKLQNFMDNTKWLYNNKDKVIDLKKKIRRLDKLVTELNFEKLKSYAKTTKDQLYETLSKKLIAMNWKNTKYEDTINLKELNNSYDISVIEYNEKYMDCHNVLKIENSELIDAVKEYEYKQLIRALEKIDYPDLTKLSYIEKKINNISVCQQSLIVSDNCIECTNCGNLNKIIESIDGAQKQKVDITRNLGSLVEKYIEKTDDLTELSRVKELYNKNETIIDYVDKKYYGRLNDVKRLITLMRDDWMGSHKEMEDLTNTLYPIINEYIKEELPLPTTVKSVKRINYNKVLTRINNVIKLSGYKKMSFADFEREILKEIKIIKDEYDEVTIVN